MATGRPGTRGRRFPVRVSRIERNDVNGVAPPTLRSCLAALDGFLMLDVRWHGETVESLVDAENAALQDRTARQLGTWGWQVDVELTSITTATTEGSTFSRTTPAVGSCSSSRSSRRSTTFTTPSGVWTSRSV